MDLAQYAGMGLVLTIVAIVISVAGRWGFHKVTAPGGFSIEGHLRRSSEEIEADRQDRREAKAAARDQTGHAFERYAEAAVAILPIALARDSRADELERWFDVLASALASSLGAGGDFYRVAIWADTGDPAFFAMMGSANHRKNDPDSRRLRKSDTIGAHAFGLRAGEYLCSDRRSDCRYKDGRRTSKPYLSIYAIRLGTGSGQWGVMTVDARKIGTEAFREAERVIVKRFALLASTGAGIAASGVFTEAAASNTGALLPERIVRPSN